MPTARFAVFLLLYVPICLLAQAPEKSAVPKPDYSQEAAVIEDFTYKVKFESDGTALQEEYSKVRVQSDAGVQRYGLLTFAYASDGGPYEIQFVRVTKPDGTVVETPADSIQDMPAEITRQAPFYSDLRQKHVAVKGLGIGDILEYKAVARVTKPLAPGQFWFNYTFTHDAVLLHEELEVIVPRDRAIKCKSPDIKPTISDAGAYRVYSWANSSLSPERKSEAVESAKKEWEQARGLFPQPDVQLSSFPSWDEVGRWYRDLQVDRIKPTPEIVAKAAELTKGAADDDAKIRAIYKYVSGQFRYIGIAFGVGRYQPHFAAEVLANQYGDCKDKHTLLAALLEAVNIKADPALINTEHEIDPDVPSPSQFDHVITVILRNGANLWMDATPEVAAFQYLIPQLRDKHALLLGDDGHATLVLTPAVPPFAAKQSFNMEAKLDENGTLTGSTELTLRGDLEFVLRNAFRATPMPQWKELTQQISQNMGFAGEVSDVSVSSPDKTDEPLRITYKYARKEFADWSHRRILSPSPYVGLNPISDDMGSLSVPFWLGQPVEVVSHTQLQIPGDYILTAPSAIHLKRPFAAFDATFKYNNGQLTADRRLRLFSSELNKADFSDYKGFCKTVQDDYGSFIQLVSAQSVPAEIQAASTATMMFGSLRGLPESSNEEALRFESDAHEAFGRQNPQNAVTLLYRAVAADPKFVRAWATLGLYLITTRQFDPGMDAFKKAIAADPQEAATQKLYALALTNTSKFEEAIPIWQSFIRLVPEDADGPGNLGIALIQLKRYDEGERALESAVELDPENVNYQLLLGTAYLRDGKEAKADTIYQKLLNLDAPQPMLDQSAYDMADSDKTPLVALKLAQKSVQEIEEASTKLGLDNLKPGDAELAVRLASSWGTLGWVQERLGKLDEAEKPLLASWKLTQSGIAAAHLCELYLAQNKTQSAHQMCLFARNRLPMENNALQYHVPELLEKNNARLEKLASGSTKTYNMNTIDQVIGMRDFKLPRVFAGTATAEFYVLFEFDSQAGHFKALDAQYIAGSEKLKAVGKSLSKLTPDFTSPDGKPVRFVRRGTLICGEPSGCEFMLSDANAPTHSFQLSPNTFH
jgi:tetratricopeptide (TPR) repeat protein